jgi:aspartate dehydrogenase
MGPAQSGWGKLILPSGAIGGLDALVAMRLAGDIQVLYRSRKPPGAWSGTPAAQLCDLDNLKKEVAFYKDTARRAVMDYPRNTNVAASVAFAGVGLDATRVELMADPEVTTNIHEIEATGPTGRFHIILEGLPDPANLKTSMLTAYSLAAEILAHSHQRGMFKKSDAIA